MNWQRMWKSVAKLSLSVIAGAAACSGTVEPEVEVTTSDLDSSRLYGTYCQQDFQNNWRATLDGTWTMCSNFNSAMNNLSPRSFYYNMHGAAWHWENSGDQENGGGLDGVDLVFISTHGGAWTGPARATQCMYEQDSRAYSTDWRFGDENRGLSAYATHSCETLKNDGYILDRWMNAFDGGLRIAVGSHGDLYIDTDDGKRFANNMGSGQTIKDAWKNALSGGSPDQDVAVLATGANGTDCWNRMGSIKWSNLTTVARLQDAAWQTWCQSQWDNL